MKYNRLSPRQGLGLANFKQWSEGGSSRSRAPVPRYRGTVTVRLCSISRMFYAAFLQLIPFPSISYPLWDELTKLDLSAGAEMVSRCGISKSVYDSWPSWTFTLKCCPGPEMVCQQSLSRYLLASQDLLLFVLFVFSCFGSGVCICFQNPNSKIQNLTSQSYRQKHEAVAESFVGPSPFLCFSLDFSGPKTPRQKMGEFHARGPSRGGKAGLARCILLYALQAKLACWRRYPFSILFCHWSSFSLILFTKLSILTVVIFYRTFSRNKRGKLPRASNR